MGTTTVMGLPYPEPTDAVADGAAAIRALAEATDTDLNTAQTTAARAEGKADQAQLSANSAGQGAVTADNKANANAAAIANMLHPPAQSPIGMAGKSVSTTEIEIGRFTVPTQGLYLVGYQLDIAPATAFGFLDAYLKVGVAAIVAIFPLKWMEPVAGSRAIANGLALADFNAGSVVQLMAKTFAGTVTVNGATVTAPLLRTP